MFRADIEGLRAIAVLAVLGFHAGVPYMGGGYVGVDVFYVISGFLITRLMLRDAEGARLWAFLGDFYARRIRRILPAATLVLVATLVGAAIVQNAIENAGIASDARATSLFVSNFRFANQASDYFNAGNAPSPFLQYWSLSLEEQFYLVWPVIFFVLVAWSRLHRSRLFVGLCVLVTLSFTVSMIWMHTAPINAFYLLPARAWELGCGALLAVSEPFLTTPLRRATRAVLAIVGVGSIIAAICLLSPNSEFPGWRALLPTLGASLTIAAGGGPASPTLVSRMIGASPMRVIGRYSYSLYLWHWPALVIHVEHFKRIYASWPARATYMLAAAVVGSVLTFRFIEDPARRSAYLRSSNRRSIALGGVLIGAALLSSFVFELGRWGGALDSGRTVASSNGILGVTVKPTNFVPSNLVPSLSDSRDRNYVACGSPCVVGSSHAHHKIVLFGNSHAGHWGTAFETAAERVDATVEIHAPGGCASFLFPSDLMTTADRAACDAQRTRIFADIDAMPPDVVVLSNMSADVFAAHPREWESGVRDAIRRLPKKSRVLVFAETPRGSRSIPLCLAQNIDHAERCDQTWPVELNAQLAKIVAEEHASFVELHDLFCVGSRCPAITEDTLIYGDTDHLTVPFSRARGRWVAELLADNLK